MAMIFAQPLTKAMAAALKIPYRENMALIQNIHHKPELLSVEQKKSGILADYQAPAQQPRKIAYELIDTVTKEIWAEYVDRPPTQEETMEELLEKVNLLLSQQETIITKQEALDAQLKSMAK